MNRDTIIVISVVIVIFILICGLFVWNSEGDDFPDSKQYSANSTSGASIKQKIRALIEEIHKRQGLTIV